MTRKTDAAREDACADSAGKQGDDPPPDERRKEETTEAEHHFRDWALI
jgi:hypothetical protein